MEDARSNLEGFISFEEELNRFNLLDSVYYKGVQLYPCGVLFSN